VGLRLTLEYLTISPSSESSSSTLVQAHTYTGHACLKPPSRRLLIKGHPSRKPAALIPLVGRIRGENTGEISQE